MAIFETIDDDGSGCLSCKELCRALQTNAEFAALCSGSAEPKVLSPIAAGLIAQNLQVVRTLSSCGLDLNTDVFVSVLVLTSVHGLDCRAQVFDAEFGDNTNAICPDEFVMLCRRLAGPKQLERLHVGRGSLPIAPGVSTQYSLVHGRSKSAVSLCPSNSAYSKGVSLPKWVAPDGNLAQCHGNAWRARAHYVGRQRQVPGDQAGQAVPHAHIDMGALLAGTGAP